MLQGKLSCRAPFRLRDATATGPPVQPHMLSLTMWLPLTVLGRRLDDPQDFQGSGVKSKTIKSEESYRPAVDQIKTTYDTRWRSGLIRQSVVEIGVLNADMGGRKRTFWRRGEVGFPTLRGLVVTILDDHNDDGAVDQPNFGVATPLLLKDIPSYTHQELAIGGKIQT